MVVGAQGLRDECWRGMCSGGTWLLCWVALCCAVLCCEEAGIPVLTSLKAPVSSLGLHVPLRAAASTGCHLAMRQCRGIP